MPRNKYNAHTAADNLESNWREGVALCMKCPVRIDRSLTEEYPWGWVFYFVPEKGFEQTAIKDTFPTAFERDTGKAVIVGKKGVNFAIRHFAMQQLPEEYDDATKDA